MKKAVQLLCLPDECRNWTVARRGNLSRELLSSRPDPAAGKHSRRMAGLVW